MRHSLTACIVLCVVATCVGAEEEQKQVPLSPPAGVYNLHPYRYVLTHVIGNDGAVTQVGRLFPNGRAIAGSDFYRLELPVGSFIWHPAEPSVHSSSHLVGWIRINPAKKYSRWSMALIEPKPTGAGQVLRTVMRNPLPPRNRDIQVEKDSSRVQ